MDWGLGYICRFLNDSFLEIQVQRFSDSKQLSQNCLTNPNTLN